MLQPKRTKFRKQHKGRIHGAAKGGTALNFGAFGLKATRARTHHCARDRSRAPRHHAPHEACGPRLDSRVPGCAGVEEARRSAHGLGQGRAGISGWPRSSRAASCSRSTASTTKQRRKRCGWVRRSFPLPPDSSRALLCKRTKDDGEKENHESTIFAARPRTNWASSS